MARRKKAQDSFPAEDLLPVLGDRIRPPIGIVLGETREIIQLVAELDTPDIVCYQMDMYQAERLRSELVDHDLEALVVTAPDLWDLPDEFETVLYPVPRGGERNLKIDMIEQAFHVLRPRGLFATASPFEKDTFLPKLLKKIFGKVHVPEAGQGMVFWARRDGDHPRRRHEVTFQARILDGPSLRFISRPGVFAYGRLDEGARALLETSTIRPGEHVLDLGCGCGTNGIFASQRNGPNGGIALVDSNVRAVALAEMNARANGVSAFQASATSQVEGLPEAHFDVVLTNPPYFAHSRITRLFVERSRILLRPGGRLYLVTRQPHEMGPIVLESFTDVEAIHHRGYVIFSAHNQS